MTTDTTVYVVLDKLGRVRSVWMTEARANLAARAKNLDAGSADLQPFKVEAWAVRE